MDIKLIDFTGSAREASAEWHAAGSAPSAPRRVPGARPLCSHACLCLSKDVGFLGSIQVNQNSELESDVFTSATVLVKTVISQQITDNLGS